MSRWPSGDPPEPAAGLGTLDGVDLGTVGIWWSGPWRAGDAGTADVAGEMEDLGYTALWSSGGFDPGLSMRFERLLAATTSVAVASGIVSIWVTSPDDVSRRVADLDATYPGRFVLGLGASHAPLVEDYSRPYSHMVRYLDGLDAAGVVTKQRRVLAALGPRMLELAGTRAAGAHPYFVPPEHVARARDLLGTDALIAVELAVVMDSIPSSARATARRHTAIYVGLPNYTNNLRAFGFGDDDFAGQGSDRLVDAIVAWGGIDAIVGRIQAMRDAGADHVCVQVIRPDDDMPRAEWRELAASLVP